MEHIELFGQFGILILLLLLGLIAGGMAERRHLSSLAQREAANGDFLVCQVRSMPLAVAGPSPPTLITSETVVASDYLKSFLSGIRKIFGGELRSYNSLAVRARREALQKLIEVAKGHGYNALCNLRFESADIGGNAKKRGRLPMVAIMASATAYHCSPVSL